MAGEMQKRFVGNIGVRVKRQERRDGTEESDTNGLPGGLGSALRTSDVNKVYN